MGQIAYNQPILHFAFNAHFALHTMLISCELLTCILAIAVMPKLKSKIRIQNAK